MIGSRLPQPKLEDLRPTRLHIPALLCLLITSLGGAYLVRHQPFWDWQGTYLVTFGAIALNVVVTMSLGGPLKLWTDWRDRNWYGYFWVLWQTKPRELEGHFLNFRNLEKVVMKGWSLYVPAGRWFHRPFLSWEGSKSTNFRITRARIGEFGGVDEVCVTDRSGDRLTMHPAEILGRLEAAFPDGDAQSPWVNGLLVISRHREHCLVEAGRVARDELETATRSLKALDGITSHLLNVLDGLRSKIDGSNRLKTTKEGREFRDTIVAELATANEMIRGILKGKTGVAHGFRF